MSSRKASQPQPAGEIEVDIDEGKIRTGAYLLSQLKKTYNDYVWMLAEADLKLSKVFPEGTNPLKGPTPKSIRLNPSKIIAEPLQGDIKKLAESIAKQGIKIQDLHWFIAIRNYLIDELKNKK
nr:hypothetical protein [Candidatus Sigynarchaeota archaeon]